MTANDKPQTSDSGRAARPPAADAVVLYATFPDRVSALNIGRGLVEARLAGCINVLPQMTSVYVWNGATETADEAVMIAKLAAGTAERAIAFIKSRHSYETPAIVLLPVIGGNAEYIAWVLQGCGQPSTGGA